MTRSTRLIHWRISRDACVRDVSRGGRACEHGVSYGDVPVRFRLTHSIRWTTFDGVCGGDRRGGHVRRSVRSLNFLHTSLCKVRNFTVEIYVVVIVLAVSLGEFVEFVVKVIVMSRMLS